jgi:Flp pilus assembly protein TadG
MSRSLPLILRRLGPDQDGAAVVEFALVAPLLIALVAGLAELSLALTQFQAMQFGVREAARYVSRAPGACGGLDAAAWPIAVAEARTVAAAYPGWPSDATLTVAPTCSANAVDTGGLRTWRGADQVASVTVTATAPYRDLGLLGLIGAGPITLSASASQYVTGG